MIWFEQHIHITDIPENDSIILIGKLHNNNVTLSIVYCRGEELFESIEFSKSFSMWQHQDFTKDDVFNKFSGKVYKIIEKYKEMKFDEWLKHFSLSLLESDKARLQNENTDM